MREMFDCALDNRSLNEIDPCIFIEEIRETVQSRFNTEEMPVHGLKQLGNLEHQSITITIKLMIKERDRERRREVIDMINAWAYRGGWLSISTRPMMRIHVAYTSQPETEALKWSNSLEFGFTAFEFPYWQDIVPTTATLTAGTTGSTTLRPYGTHPCYLEASVVNGSGSAVTSLTLTANGKSISFTGMSLANGKTFTLAYDDSHILCADADGTSVLDKRTAASEDDLILNVFEDNTISYTASGSCTVTISARGVYE